MPKINRHSPELRERAVRLLREQRHEYPSDWAAMTSIAQKIGCSRESLRRWAQQSEVDTGERTGTSTAEKERLAELEKEVRELRRANEILRKASAYFAQAELDRR